VTRGAFRGSCQGPTLVEPALPGLLRWFVSPSQSRPPPAPPGLLGGRVHLRFTLPIRAAVRYWD